MSEARGGEIQYWQPNIVRRAASNAYDAVMYDGLWDKWSHSLFPTPLNPLSPLFAVLDPYYMERAHSEDMPYAKSGPMFTEGTPWGAVLNPTIGALIKPEKDLHTFRFDHGVDILGVLKVANESIREYARDFTKTHYISVKGGQVSAVNWNAWNAPTPDTKVLSVNTSSSGLVKVNEGIYGIYGDGSRGYGLGAAGGAAGTSTYVAGKLGVALGGGYDQDTLAGFNPFFNDTEFSSYFSNVPSLNERILARAEPVSTGEAFRTALFGNGNRYVRHGEIVVNEKGELGIYQNRPIAKLGGAHFSVKDSMAIDAVTSEYVQDDKMFVLDTVNKYVPASILKGLNEKLIQQSKQHVDSPYAVDEDLGFTTTEKLSTFNPSQAMELLDDADTVSDLMNQGNGSDFVRNATTSMRLIGGIYGYMGSELVGLGVHENKVIANSSDMYAFNRKFWDLNLGGAGGAVSEIGRRFIPNFQRLTKVDPLLNEMPDWLPERFRVGNPYCISDDTLVEIDKLQFIEAYYVQRGNNLISHTGVNRNVENIKRRAVRDQEKVYQLKITSLTAVESKFSEDHPILTFDGKLKTISDLKVNIRQSQKLTKYIRYNNIISCLLDGITEKKTISEITGISIDWIYLYFKDLVKLGIIEDYKKDKCHIYPVLENLKLFDLNLVNKKLAWKKVKDIHIGDYVAYPIPVYQEQDVVIDMADITDYPYSEKYIYTSGQCSKQDFVEAYEWLEQNGIPKFQWGKRKGFLALHNWTDKAYENAQAMLRHNKVPERMQRYVTITPELAYAMGLWLAEGWVENSTVSYALHQKEYSLFSRSVKGIQQAGFNITNLTWRPSYNSMGATGFIFCKPLTYFMEYMMGKYAHCKKLNDVLWNMKSSCLLRLLEGYIDGDGYAHETITGHSERDSYRVGIASCNLKLLLQIRKLCLRFGIVLHVRKKGIPEQVSIINGTTVNTGTNYTAVTNGQSAVDFAKLLWDKNVVYKQSKKSPCHTFIMNGYIFMRVQDVIECHDIQFVNGYQMAIEESFCTAGIATHNTRIPHGEMRLPGKGYETVNDLHPDQFSTEKDRTGAFDRFKILADIAPGTPEYKLWREIAKKTVTDPELLQEMEEIKQRAREQGKKHDFYNYKLVGRELNYRNIVVSEVLDHGKFRSGETIYKMAGITVQGNPDENAKEVLSRYLRPGQNVVVAVDTNPVYARNKDAQKTLNAAVYTNGESVNQLMLESGDAKKRKSDKSAAADIEQLSGLQYGIGLASEVIGHMDIPIISDQWLRIRSPYESYLAEQVYGTPYQSWAHPIDTFLYPAIERAVHEQSARDLFLFDIMHKIQRHDELTLFDLTKYGINIKTGTIYIKRDIKNILYMTSILGNRATLVGHALGNMLDAGNSKLAMPLSYGLNVAVTAAHMATGGNSMYNMLSLGAYTGLEVARINEVTSASKRIKYVAAGAALSGGYRLLRNSLLGEWTPSRQHKRHEMEEYWDRLNYIKWQGLYEEAARRALDEEGVDVDLFLKNTEDRERERKFNIDKLKKIKDSLNAAYDGKTNYIKNYLLKLVNSRIAELKPREQLVEGGKYTQSAIIYKRAAEATMYGLKDGASWSSIISALPTNDREYFMEFVSESDETKRDKILAIASPSLKKALQMSWGMKTDKQKDNENFFATHYLPDSDWKGWRPDVDLKDIEVKTVNNEAMNLSDFGFYESSLREPEVQEATPLPYNHENDDIRLRSELKKILKGKGLTNVEVDVSARNTMSATDVIANIAVWTGLKEQRKRVEDTAGAWI